MYYKRKPKFSKFFAKVCSTKQIWDWDKEKNLHQILQELSNGTAGGGGLANVTFNGKTLSEVKKRISDLEEGEVLSYVEAYNLSKFFEALEGRFQEESISSEDAESLGVNAIDPIIVFHKGDIEFLFAPIDKESDKNERNSNTKVETRQLWEIFDLSLELHIEGNTFVEVLTYDAQKDEFEVKTAGKQEEKGAGVSSFFATYLNTLGFKNLYIYYELDRNTPNMN